MSGVAARRLESAIACPGSYGRLSGCGRRDWPVAGGSLYQGRSVLDDRGCTVFRLQASSERAGERAIWQKRLTQALESRGFVQARTRLPGDFKESNFGWCDTCDRFPCYPRHACARTPYIGRSVTSVTEQQVITQTRSAMISERSRPEWLDLKALQGYACVSERTLREWIHRVVDPLRPCAWGARSWFAAASSTVGSKLTK